MSKVSKSSNKHVRTSPRVQNDFLSPKSSTRELAESKRAKQNIDIDVGSVLSSSGAE